MSTRGKNTTEIQISNKTILRVIGMILIAALAVQIFENLVNPLTLIFISFFLALALNQAVNWLARHIRVINRTGATALSYVFIITLLAIFLSLVVPPLVTQTRDFVNNIPSTVKDLEDDEGVVGSFVNSFNIQEQLDELAIDWSSVIRRAQGPVVSTANRVLSSLVSILTVLVLTFMMLVEGPRWLKAFWKQYPKSSREHHKKLSLKMYDVVKNYVNGQIIVAAIGATFSVIAIMIATTIFKVDTINAIAFGGIVFIFSLIPTIGAILSAFVVVLFSSFASIPLAVTMLVYFIVYQQIENVTIQPLIQSRGNNLTPMLVFIAAILGIGFGGVLGAFIAIPVAGCLRVFLTDYLSRKSDT